MTVKQDIEATLHLADLLDSNAKSLRATVASLQESEDWRVKAVAWLKSRTTERPYPSFVLRTEAARRLAEELEKEM